MIQTVLSKHGVPIRLTDERWAHIVEEHAELAGHRLDVLTAVSDPERILRGHGGERLAVREAEPGKFLVAVYREGDRDGFIITAFLTRRMRALAQREVLWTSQPS